jgi:hypothetical protein
MKKVIAIIIIILLLLAGAAYYVHAKSTSYATEYMTKALNTPVHIGNLTLGPRQIMVENFRVTDPSAKHRSILTVKRITINYELSSLLKEAISISDIIIDYPFAYIEAYNTKGTENNWLNFLKNIQVDSGETSYTLLIDTLAINNLSADLQHPILGKVHLPVRKPIVIRNIDSGNTLESEKQLSIIVAALMEVLSQYPGLAGLDDGIASIITFPAGVISNLTTQVAGQATDLISSGAAVVGTAIGEGIESVKDFFSNLFN